MSKRTPTRLSSSVLLLLVIFCYPGSSAFAATPVFADPSQTCAGLSPCYATIQEAVDNAGPAPAEVGIFPGTYAESVDLSSMGSNITGGGPGNITIQALDATGQPATDGVQIDPDAPGGPGTGAGLISGEVSSFEGDITLRGVSVTSPDTFAVGIQTTGNLTVEDVAVQDAAASGLAGLAAGDVTLTRVEARMNGEAGIFSASLSGNLTATDLEAFENVDEGIVLGAETLVVQGAEASANQTGARLIACISADVSNVTTNVNQENGMVIIYGPDDCEDPPEFTGHGSWSDSEGLELPDRMPLSLTGTPAGTVNASNLVSVGNANAGIGIVSSTGEAQITDAGTIDNLFGMLVISRVVVLDDIETIGNESGMVILADDALITRVNASQNQPIPPDPTTGGVGLSVTARLAVLDNIQADDNSLAGLALGAPEDGSIPDYTVIGSQFDGNATGILTQPSVSMDVILDGIALTDNPDAGVLMLDLGAASFSNLAVSGSKIGMDLFVNGLLSIETAEMQTNITGIVLGLAQGGQARINCSNFFDNRTAGIELAQGANLPATANYWDDPSGPTHPGNPGGTGDLVIDSANGGAGIVDYSGFLGEPASAADCPQRIPESVPVPTMSRGGLVVLAIALMMMGWVFSRSTSRD